MNIIGNDLRKQKEVDEYYDKLVSYTEAITIYQSEMNKFNMTILRHDSVMDKKDILKPKKMEIVRTLINYKRIITEHKKLIHGNVHITNNVFDKQMKTIKYLSRKLDTYVKIVKYINNANTDVPKQLKLDKNVSYVSTKFGAKDTSVMEEIYTYLLIDNITKTFRETHKLVPSFRLTFHMLFEDYEHNNQLLKLLNSGYMNNSFIMYFNSNERQGKELQKRSYKELRKDKDCNILSSTEFKEHTDIVIIKMLNRVNYYKTTLNKLFKKTKISKYDNVDYDYDKKTDEVILSGINVFNKMLKNKDFDFSISIYKEVKNSLVFRFPVNLYNKYKATIIDKSYEKYYDFNTLLWLVKYRYHKNGFSSGLYGSVHPDHYKILQEEYDVNVELFAGFFNKNLKRYFSLFYDLEKYFGSLGNVFNAKLSSGTYLVNPPYTYPYILKTVKYCRMQIKKANSSGNPLCFILVLPTRTYKDRLLTYNLVNKDIGIKDRTDQPIDKHDSNYYTIDNLVNNKYVSNYVLYKKDNFKFYSMLSQCDVYYCNVTVITIESTTSTGVDIIDIFGKPDIVCK